jgi:peptide/nickel transport system substrate-binding protein
MSFSLRRFSVALLALAAGCGPTDRSTVADGDTGGTLVIALPVEPSTLLPPLVRFAHEKEIADQLFDALAEIGPDLNTLGDAGWTPRLAESWQWASDSLSIAFRIHPDARWHDGRRITAGDVRFTFNLIKNPSVGAKALPLVTDVDSVSAPDSLTAVVWFAHRSPEQFYNFAYNVVPVPEHLLRDSDPANLATHPFSRNPVGSGPFRFFRWEARSLLEVTADTSHYLGRPLLDRVIWMLNPDITAALVNVLAGSVDLFEIVTPDGMTRIAAQEAVLAVPYANPNYGYLGFNFRDPRNPERPHPLFGDRNLRRAIAMAIDRQALLQNVFDSLAWPAVGPVSRMIATADTSLAMVPFDAAGVDQLLDSLGWRDQDGDGVREKGGRPLRFGILTPSSSAPRRRYAELIQAQLKPHGIRVDVDVSDMSVVQGRMYGSRFDALLNSWLSEPSPSTIRESWHTMPASRRASNLQLYGNPLVDAAIDSAMIEPDPARSRAHYRRAYQGIIDDVAGVWLYENRFFMALNRRVHPVIRGADSWWRHLRLWSIPAANRLPRDAR